MADNDIRAEADELLYGRGLLELARGIGEPFVGGSHHSDLMTWRDLDLYIRAPGVRIADWFAFGGRAAELLGASRASFRDNRDGGDAGLPAGLYFGVKQGDVRRGAWKLDLWALDDAGFERTRRGAEEFAARVTPAARAAILRIKAAYWDDPRYRDTVTSAMIYEAVLDDGVDDPGRFERWLGGRPGGRG